MTLPTLEYYSSKELLQLNGKIIDELLKRKVVRTSNNPVSGYTEWLVAKSLGLTLCNNSEKGYDGIDREGIKYEIKSRRITPTNASRQLSAIRDIDGEHFDFLIAVVYDANYEVILALKIPKSIVIAKSKYVAQTNSYKLMAEDSLRFENEVEELTFLLKQHE